MKCDLVYDQDKRSWGLYFDGNKLHYNNFTYENGLMVFGGLNETSKCKYCGSPVLRTEFIKNNALEQEIYVYFKCGTKLYHHFTNVNYQMIPSGNCPNKQADSGSKYKYPPHLNVTKDFSELKVKFSDPK